MPNEKEIPELTPSMIMAMAAPKPVEQESVITVNGTEVRIRASSSAMNDPQEFFRLADVMAGKGKEPLEFVDADGKKVVIDHGSYLGILGVLEAVIVQPKMSIIEWAMFGRRAGVGPITAALELAMNTTGLDKAEEEREGAKKKRKAPAR